MFQGIVKWYSPQKGYGFILGDNGDDIFVHRSDLSFWTIFLTRGERVRYSLQQTKCGIKATEITQLKG